MKTLVLPRFRRARHRGGSLGLAAIDGQSRRRLAASTLGILACSGVWAFSVLSPGYPPGAVEVYASRAWLTSSRIGQIALVDGSTTDVAAQLDLHRPGRDLVVAQSGADAILADSTDGAVLRVDGATLGVSPPVFPFGHDATSLSLSVGGGTAYAVDNRRGIVVGLDPTTLAVRADPVPVAARISSDASMVDRDGRLWSVDDATGDVVSVHSGDKTVATRAGTAGKVALLAANGRPVAVDLAQHTVSRFNAKSGQLEGSQPIELRPDDAVTVGASRGADEVFAAVTNRGVLIICDLEAGANRVVQLPPGLSRLGRPVEAHGRVFLPDLGTGLVHIVDTTSRRFVTSVTVPGGPAGHLQLIPREDRVFYNDPDSERAGAILMDGTLTAASKYNPTNPSEGLTPAPADVTPVNLAPIAQPSSRTTETPPPPDSSAATSTQANPADSVPRQGSAGTDPLAGGRGSGGQGGASAGGIGAGGQGGQSGQGAISPSPAATPTETPRVTPTDTTRPPSLEGTITLTSRAPVVGQTVNLQMLINGVPAATAVSWSFGDGTRASGNPIAHTWQASSGDGVYVITATAQVDGSSVQATAQVSVKITPDTTAPVIWVPTVPEQTVPYGSTGLRVYYPPPTAKDDRDPNPHLNCTASSGDLFGPGRTDVTCTARDSSGNSSTRGFPVTVTQGPAPDPVCDPYSPPAPKSTVSGTTVIVTYPLPKCRDATGPATVSCKPASGSRFGEGPTMVTCTATNSAGRTATMSFAVTVIGIDPPEPDPDPLVCSKKPYLPQCGGP